MQNAIQYTDVPKSVVRFFRKRLTYPSADIEGVATKDQDEAKRLADIYKRLKNVQDEDPKFIRRVFVSHYCNIPYHMLDTSANLEVCRNGVYPSTLIDDLYAASFFLIRNFELAPYASDTKLEDLISAKVSKGEI